MKKLSTEQSARQEERRCLEHNDATKIKKSKNKRLQNRSQIWNKRLKKNNVNWSRKEKNRFKMMIV